MHEKLFRIPLAPVGVLGEGASVRITKALS